MFAAVQERPQEVTWQASLFALGAPAVDAGFADLRRHWLDDASWVDHQPGWLQGADDLLAELVGRIAWRQREVTMYGRRLAEPRLTAWWTVEHGGDLLAPVLADAWRLLGRQYDRAFDSLGANLYRDGHDSVAWHGDRIRHVLDDPVVAIVSLGSPRPFLIRPRGGGRSQVFLPAGGDLLVMGGRCQHDWEHAVPKVAVAGPRLSLMFRHGADPPDPPGSLSQATALGDRGSPAQDRHEPHRIVTKPQHGRGGPSGDWLQNQPQGGGR